MARIPQVKFKVNLEEMFGERFQLNRSTREAIGQALIDRIVSRTQDGVDKNGKSMGSYSPAYRSSLAFKVTKGGERTVNLTQTGDMLGSLTIIDQSPQTITLGFDDPEQNTKAYGHISGMKGNPFLEGKVKPRDFLGLPKSEIKNVAERFESQVRRIDRIEDATTRAELDSAVLDIIDEIGGEIESGSG